MKDQRKTRRGERGASTVEMALVLPVLLLLMFGSIEFARYFWQEHSVTAAATEGARMAILNPDVVSDAQVIAWAEQVATDGGVAGTPTVTINPSPRTRNQMVTVQVSVPFQPLILPKLVSGLVMPASITSTATMMVEP